MGRINMGRVLIGGLAAGFVINCGEFVLNSMVLAADMEAYMSKVGLTMPGGSQIAWFVLFGFALGIVTTWLYAAIRPRFGPGPKTAIVAGLVAWFLAALYPSLFFLVLGMMPAGSVITGIIWELVEMPLAALVGGALYKE
jgi:pimeloyl-ACP methyl ester carboxylesterase